MNTPDQTLSVGDPGDETARRFRFQYTYAAILCCALLDETQDLVEVLCEHYEDVLLKHTDDIYTGLQVKTRDLDQPPWKAGDEQVVASFAKFLSLEKQFPGRFRGYCFLTNHYFLTNRTANSLPFILESVRVESTLEALPSSVKGWINKVAKRAGVSEYEALAVLKKSNAKDDLPKLADCMSRLVETLTFAWGGARDCTHDSVRRAAAALADECGRASSLAHEQLLPGYFSAVSAAEDEVRLRIDGKRMTADRVRLVIETGRDAKALLAGAPANQPEPAEGGTETLIAKLDAGGFSAISRDSAINLRDKADYLALVWLARLGKEKMLARYDHIQTLVWSDASRAFESTKSDSDAFGPDMREALRSRFLARRHERSELYDCTDEHLEGFAYMLTSACKVRWSKRLPWEKP